MSNGRTHLPPVMIPKADLTLCSREPIHVPGAIQPHGALLAMAIDTQMITHASANLAGIFGQQTDEALGQPLAEILGKTTLNALMDTGSPGANMPQQAHSGLYCDSLHFHAHRSGRYVVVDIEPTVAALRQNSPVTLVQSVLETFKNAANQAELCELAVRGLKAITGYDRVLAYRFATDGHGEVIAEDCAVHLEPYLGLRYPAGDIPS